MRANLGERCVVQVSCLGEPLNPCGKQTKPTQHSGGMPVIDRR